MYTIYLKNCLCTFTNHGAEPKTTLSMLVVNCVKTGQPNCTIHCFTLHSLRFLRSLRVKRSLWSSSDAPNTAAQNCKNLICLCCEIMSIWGNIEARLLPVIKSVPLPRAPQVIRRYLLCTINSVPLPWPTQVIRLYLLL